jgi:tRNA (mo5U34)-methyltransferase
VQKSVLNPEIHAFLARAGVDKSANLDLLIEKCAAERQTKLGTEFWAQYVTDNSKLKHKIDSDYSCNTWDIQDGVVEAKGDFSPEFQLQIEKTAHYLHPWRKGPFKLGSLKIDAEWKSDLKWSRIEKSIPNLSSKVVLDCGCNNGYYLFRMAKQQPKAILGIDPNDRFFFQYDFVRTLSNFQDAQFELLGVEDIELFPTIFDAVFCLGVIYHRRDPLGMLASIKKSIRPNGFAVIESITLPGKLGDVTYISDRYSQMRNVFFLPSSETLAAWMSRVGFKNVKIIDQTLTTVEEQRKTEFAWFDSLSDFLDPNDYSKTKEGYPAPSRTTVIGYV